MLLHFLAIAASVAATEVSVVWRHEKPSASTSLTVYSATGMDTILAEACGNTIGSLDFSRVDEHGVGNFTVADEVFDVFSEPTNGAPRCTRVFNELIAVVECTGVHFDVPSGVTKSGDCFTIEHAKHSFERLKTRSASVNNATAHVEDSVENVGEPGRLSRILGGAMSRIAGQKRACGSGKFMEKVGDGNPHQNYLHKQISENMRCGTADTCGTDAQTTTSFTIGFSTEISPGAGALKGWTKAGFSVQKSWTTGNSYRCNGKAGETLCIWYNTAHTAYTVREYDDTFCFIQMTGEGIIKSPNQNNKGGDYYCVVGTCRSKGEQYWDNTGRAGGP